MRKIKMEELTKETVEKWLTKQIRAMHKIKHTGYFIEHKGKEYTISNIGYSSGVHLLEYKTLKLLARILDKDILSDSAYDEDRVERYFIYKGERVFALAFKEEVENE